jgi:hypothetical protein
VEEEGDGCKKTQEGPHSEEPKEGTTKNFMLENVRKGLKESKEGG